LSQANENIKEPEHDVREGLLKQTCFEL